MSPGEKRPVSGIGTLESAMESLLRWGAVKGTVTCYMCGHSIHLHYENEIGHHGCVVDQPSVSLEALIRGRQPSQLTTAAGTCLCVGWVRGQLPHAMTKHLDGLTDPDDELPCSACTHPMHEHSNPEGCWQCPCTVMHVHT